MINTFYNRIIFKLWFHFHNIAQKTRKIMPWFDSFNSIFIVKFNLYMYFIRIRNPQSAWRMDIYSWIFFFLLFSFDAFQHSLNDFWFWFDFSLIFQCFFFGNFNGAEGLISTETFCRIFPFHVMFDRRMQIVQVGKSASRIIPR